MSEVSATDGNTYQVQYFERAVFEMHPEKAAPNNVLLSLLGTQKYGAKYGASASATAAPFAGATTPTAMTGATATTSATATMMPTAAATATSVPPTATIAATATATGTTVPAATSVTFTNITSPVKHGANATATVQTAPYASCKIEVDYKSGESKAAGLADRFADGAGVVSWTWVVGTRTTPGTWPVTVTCTGGGKSAVGKASIQVT